MIKNGVYFDRSELLITVVTDGVDYSINLLRARNSAELLDWILQIANKTWCTPRVLYDLMKTIESACEEVLGGSAQGAFCPNGRDRQVDWRTPKSAADPGFRPGPAKPA